MKTLEKEFTAEKGHHFRQIAREGMKAIYHRTKGRVEDWEVIIIRTSKAGSREIEEEGERVEIEYGESEVYPRSNQWGKLGWTYTSEEAARKKFETLKA